MSQAIMSHSSTVFLLLILCLQACKYQATSSKVNGSVESVADNAPPINNAPPVNGGLWQQPVGGAYTLCGTNPNAGCIPVKDEMMWVFLGDSYTDQQRYNVYIESYFHLRFPELKLHFRGEGRSGGSMPEAMQERYEERVYAWHPDVVSTMFSTNGGPTPEQFDNDLRTIVRDYFIGRSGAIPVLFSSYPQNTVDGSEISGRYADKLAALGAEKGYPYADIWHSLWPIWVANKASSTPVNINGGLSGTDTDHLGDAGHLGAAYGLLSQLGAPGEVSTVALDASNGTLIASMNATVSDIQITTVGIDFKRLDTRLPMAFDDGARPILQMMPEIYELNKYGLTVQNLDPGTYEVFVDGVLSATVSSLTLAAGWNMTTMTQGPIHDQLKSVLEKIRLKEGVATMSADGIVYARTAPWTGVHRYKSNSNYWYGIGDRGEVLRQDLITGKYGNAIGDTADLDVAIFQASQPVLRSFSLRKL